MCKPNITNIVLLFNSKNIQFFIIIVYLFHIISYYFSLINIIKLVIKLPHHQESIY